MSCFVLPSKNILENWIPFKTFLLLTTTLDIPCSWQSPPRYVGSLFHPQNSTCLLQPTDQGPTATFKIYYLSASGKWRINIMWPLGSLQSLPLHHECCSSLAGYCKMYTRHLEKLYKKFCLHLWLGKFWWRFARHPSGHFVTHKIPWFRGLRWNIW